VHVTIVADLRAALEWLAHELRLIAAWLREPWLWLTVAVGLLLAALAYQLTPGHTIAIGGDQRTHLRHYDAPFLTRFNDPEPDPADRDWWAMPELPYRWAEPSAELVLPAIGGDRWQVRLLAASGRPDGSATTLRWAIGASPWQTITIDAAPRVYTIAGNSTAGDLRILLESPRLEAPGDPRDLGLVLYRATLTRLGGGLQIPPPGQLALHGAIAALAYAVARRLAQPWPIAAAAGLLPGAAMAALLVQNRMGLTAATPALALIALSCWLLAPALEGCIAVAARRLQIVAERTEIGAATGIALLGFAARMVGVTHPYARFSDLGFHTNNLLRLIRGQLLLTAGLPCEAGAGTAPYPPGGYLTLAPAQLLLEEGARGQVDHLIQGGVALLEGAGAAIIWLLLRRLGLGRWAALAGAALYMLPLPLLRSYTIGEMANLFAQALVPPLLLALALWPPSGAVRRWAVAVAALVAGLLLAHTGITISALCLIAGWGLLSLRAWRPRRLVALGGAVGLAGAVALAIFYSAYAHLPAQNRERSALLAAEAQRCPPGRPFASKLRDTLGLGVGPTGSIGLPLIVAAGAALGGAARRPALRLLLGAALLGTALSFATLISSDQPVRWAHFLYPALCLGGGAGLAAWRRRGAAGHVLAWGAIGYLIWFAADAWVRQITGYLH
jgi:hypothetical protein